MALTAGTVSQVAVSPNNVQMAVTAASGSTGPYTNQWHRSTTTGFTPSPATAIAGATGLNLDDTGLPPNTIQYYKVVQTDASSATVTTAQQAVTTSNQVGPQLNQMRMSKVQGMAKLTPQTNTVTAQIDSSQSGSLVAGQAVKIVDSAGGLPKVVACTSNTDNVYGFINYDAKNGAFSAGMPVEISCTGNYLYLYATTAIPRGAAVTLDTSVAGGVAAAVNSSGANIVGHAVDKAVAAGALIGVYIRAPSFAFA